MKSQSLVHNFVGRQCRQWKCLSTVSAANVSRYCRPSTLVRVSRVRQSSLTLCIAVADLRQKALSATDQGASGRVDPNERKARGSRRLHCVYWLYCVAVYYKPIAACLLQADTAAGIVIFTSLLSHAVQVWSTDAVCRYCPGDLLEPWTSCVHVDDGSWKSHSTSETCFNTFNRHMLPSSV